jgi:hypothetical protein
VLDVMMRTQENEVLYLRHELSATGDVVSVLDTEVTNALATKAQNSVDVGTSFFTNTARAHSQEEMNGIVGVALMRFLRRVHAFMVFLACVQIVFVPRSRVRTN